MPKFLTYQRPMPISKQNWNHARDQKGRVPNRTLDQQRAVMPAVSVPALEQLIRKG